MNASSHLLFLNYTNPPQEARQRGVTKQIRSFLAHKQHRSRQVRSETTDAHFIWSSKDLSEALSAIKPCKQVGEGEDAECTSLEEADPELVALSRQISYLHRSSKYRSRENQNCTDQAKRARNHIIPTYSKHSNASYPNWLLLHNGLDDPTDDLNKSCKLLGQSMSDSLHLLSNLVHALGPDLERKLNITPGLTAKYMLPMVLSDPALLAATILKCTTMICHLKGEVSQPTVMLQLRQYALARIREALEEYPSRAISDELLCAVSTLANFELVYNGNLALYNAHKMGLVKMISLRGGLQSLGKEGYTQSTLLYNDANTARLAGCVPHLAVFRRFPTDVDPGFWLQGVSMPSEELEESSIERDGNG